MVHDLSPISEVEEHYFKFSLKQRTETLTNYTRLSYWNTVSYAVIL